MSGEGKFDLEKLFFYFDSQAKDRLDNGVLGRKSSQVLQLREKLLSLPDGEFDVAIKTISKLVEEHPSRTLEQEDREKARERSEAQELYSRVSSATPVSADEVSKIR